MSLSRQRRPDEMWQRSRSGLSRDGGPVIVHRTLAYAEVGRDVLAGMTGDHQLEHLMLARR